MESAPPWQSIGRHRYRIEGDVLFAVAIGDINEEEIIFICEQLLVIYQRHGFFYEIVDATHGGAMDPAVRRRNAEWHRDHQMRGEAIVFGASLFLRTILTLFTNAIRLLERNEIHSHFVATESDARAWVSAHRQSRLLGGQR